MYIGYDGHVVSSFMHSGQVCAAGERLFVQAGIYDAFMEALNAKLDEAVFSDPLHSSNFPFCSGPVINKEPGSESKGSS